MDDEIIKEFIAESNEHLDSAENNFVLLIENSSNQDAINTIHRDFHTIKGASSFLEMDSLKNLSLDMENIMKDAGNNQIVLDKEKIGLLLQGIDVLRKMLFSQDYGDSIDTAEINSKLYSISESKSGDEILKGPGISKKTKYISLAEIPAEVWENADSKGHIFRVTLNIKVFRDSLKNNRGIIEDLQSFGTILHSDRPFDEIDKIEEGSCIIFFQTVLKSAKLFPPGMKAAKIIKKEKPEQDTDQNSKSSYMNDVVSQNNSKKENDQTTESEKIDASSRLTESQDEQISPPKKRKRRSKTKKKNVSKKSADHKKNHKLKNIIHKFYKDLTIRYFLIVIFIISLGTSGYYFIEEDWSLLDSFYMTIISITTVGFQEVHGLSPLGRIFTIFIIFLGIGIVATLGTQAAKLIIAREISGILGGKKMENRIMKMKGHYIVCGYGRIGSSICNELNKTDLSLVIIEVDDILIEQAVNKGYCVLKGNATNDDTLKDAGIDRASGVVAALSEDSDNLFISLAARELNPKIMIISRCEEHGIENRILRAGADIVVSPLKLGGQQIAQMLTQKLDSSMHGSVFNESINLKGYSLQTFSNSKKKEITIADAVSESGAICAIAVEHEDGTVISRPDDNMKISSNDLVFIFTKDAEAVDDNLMHDNLEKEILLVDDHTALRNLFQKKISSAGYDVIPATSGDEAIRIMKENTPDLIVLDVMMPGLDGYETTKIIRQTPGFETVPIILYSGDESEEFKLKGAESGATACIQKTNKSSELLDKIEELLQ